MNKDQETKIKCEFGERLKRLRKQRGYTQEELADICVLDRTYVGGVERGERNISLINIVKISNALGLSPKDLF